jgi:eukaryotic-like serine/threonine-protein kinase
MMRKKFLYNHLLTSALIVILLSACADVSPTDQPVGATMDENQTAAVEETAPQPTATEYAPQPSATPDAPMTGSMRVSEMDGMEQVYVPAGEFIMGWQGTDATIEVLPGPFPDFLEHTVTLDSYWIDRYAVTNGQYQRCVEAGACRPCGQNNIPPQGLDYFTENEYANYPVVNVSWYMARDYCTWVGRRLPSEAEWEKAARGTDGRKYPWGNDSYTEDKANICDKHCPPSVRGTIANPNFDDGFPGPSPVGNYPSGASPYGALDMAGNVWEWTSTAAEFYPYDADDGREDLYEIEDGEKWPERILRGGPWSNGISYQRSSFRYRAVAIYWNMNMGFRCASSQ